jgi:hypothetical protein
MHLIHNEQIKLRAAWLNNTSVGLALGGVYLPILHFQLDADLPPFRLDARLWGGAVTALIVSVSPRGLKVGRPRNLLARLKAVRRIVLREA